MRYVDSPALAPNLISFGNFWCTLNSVNQTAARTIKEAMDKKYGVYWHVVVGEGFGFEVSYETKNMLYLFFAGNIGIVLWKCS